jgi:hypothetical protein
MRMALPRLVLAAGLIGALAGPAVGKDGEGFPTNLALLDRLSSEAVGAVLDSLGFRQGDTITVVTEGGNEGDGFIAGAFARELARRGAAVHMTVDLAPAPPPAAPQAPAAPDQEPPEEEIPQLPLLPGAAGDTAAVNADSLRNSMPPDTTEASKQAEPEPESPAAPSRPAGSPGPTVARKAYPDGLVLEFRVLEFGVSYPGVKRRYRLFGAPTVTRLGGVYVQASRIVGPEGTVLSIASGQSHYEDRLSSKARRLAEGANYPFTKPTIPPGSLGRVVEPIAVIGIVSSLVYLFYQNQN